MNWSSMKSKRAVVSVAPRHRYGVKIAATLVAASVLGGCGSTSSTSKGILMGSLNSAPKFLPAPANSGRAVSGQLVLRSGHDATINVRIGAHGHFFVKLAPGTYRAVAGPASWHYRGCTAAGGNVVTVTAKRITNLELLCRGL